MLVYSKSHGLAIPDAIIAATSLVCNINLFTLNVKDFTFIKGITLHNM
jgi:predicted nucleic acid-binding protein